MQLLIRVAVVVLPVLYFAWSRRYYAEFHGGAEASTTRLLGRATVAVHLVLFVVSSIAAGFFAVTTPALALSALALGLVLVYQWVEWLTRVRSLGVFVLSAVFVVQCIASLFGFDPPAGENTTRGALFVVHVVTVIAGFATLLLSGFFGVLYLLMERQMRRQTFGLLYRRLPNLSELATMNRRAATVGFVLMAIGYNLGIWQAHATGMAGFSYLDPKVLGTLLVWVVFGIIALSRWLRFLTGRRTALTAVCGLLLLVVTFVFSLIPGLSFHQFS